MIFNLLQRKNIGKIVMYHSSVGLLVDSEMKKKRAEPGVVHPELKGAHDNRYEKYAKYAIFYKFKQIQQILNNLT
jgi:hypothetical protein